MDVHADAVVMKIIGEEIMAAITETIIAVVAAVTEMITTVAVAAEETITMVVVVAEETITTVVAAVTKTIIMIVAAVENMVDADAMNVAALAKAGQENGLMTVAAHHVVVLTAANH